MSREPMRILETSVYISNALFELLGAGFLCLNVKRLWTDRRLVGVSVWPTAFYFSWGLWNLYYYPSVGDWWSFGAGIFVVLTNGAWVTLALWFKAWKA